MPLVLPSAMPSLLSRLPARTHCFASGHTTRCNNREASSCSAGNHRLPVAASKQTMCQCCCEAVWVANHNQDGKMFARTGLVANLPLGPGVLCGTGIAAEWILGWVLHWAEQHWVELVLELLVQCCVLDCVLRWNWWQLEVCQATFCDRCMTTTGDQAPKHSNCSACASALPRMLVISQAVLS